MVYTKIQICAKKHKDVTKWTMKNICTRLDSRIINLKGRPSVNFNQKRLQLSKQRDVKESTLRNTFKLIHKGRKSSCHKLCLYSENCLINVTINYTDVLKIRMTECLSACVYIESVKNAYRK